MSEKSKIPETFDELCMIMSEYHQSGSFSLIEKDLVLEKLRKMYSLISKAETREENPDVNALSKEKPEVPDEEYDTEIKEEKSDKQKMPEEKQEDSIVFEDTNESIKTDRTEDQTPDGELQKNITDNSILGEKYKGSKKYMNEMISEHHPSKDISLKLQSRPIDDISKAVGLNEKFLFINQLFKGDSSLYKKTVEKLNSLGDFNEAFSFLSFHFNWDMQDETAQKFMELVRRKFITPVK